MARNLSDQVESLTEFVYVRLLARYLGPTVVEWGPWQTLTTDKYRISHAGGFYLGL